MELKFSDIVLRDYQISDIEDDIRWNTVETQWALWDAPWEMEEELEKFDSEAFRKKQMEEIKKPLEEFRWSFEVDTSEGVHIGSVNSYLIDEDYSWIRQKDVKEGQKVYRTLGIELCESSFWGRGLGSKALAAFVQYHLEYGVKELYLQTWSGNVRMIKCAEKLGFSVCARKIGIRQVRGGIYDGLTFRLDVEKFLTTKWGRCNIQNL